MKRFYKITDLIVEMDTFGRTAEQAVPYLWDGEGEADMAIVSGRESFQEKYPTATDDESEYYCTAFRFYSQLVDFDGLMLHSSAVIDRKSVV